MKLPAFKNEGIVVKKLCINVAQSKDGSGSVISFRCVDAQGGCVVVSIKRDV